MQLTRIQARAVSMLRDAATDTGRFLLFLGILSAALLCSLVLAVLGYGVFFVTGGTEPLFTAFSAGSRSAVALLNSFTEAQSSFYLMSLYSALFMGAFAYWVYQKTLSSLGRLRRWA
ncbi:hypothetical protein [Halomarina ordinaria]|uniref:Uncharacterized protein n=1 Tax=Halomarina ordinaria TaxID=3033939 RepID=A0ABD5UHH2_9EURY|nr:hypothetical protein [Halomarina sp. PSRA2]